MPIVQLKKKLHIYLLRTRLLSCQSNFHSLPSLSSYPHTRKGSSADGRDCLIFYATRSQSPNLGLVFFLTRSLFPPFPHNDGHEGMGKVLDYPVFKFLGPVALGYVLFYPLYYIRVIFHFSLQFSPCTNTPSNKYHSLLDRNKKCLTKTNYRKLSSSTSARMNSINCLMN